MSDRDNHNQIFGNPSQSAGPQVGPGIQKMSAAERMQREFGVVIPAEVIQLPSGGKIYSQDSGLYGVNQLQIKAMTTKEEDILTSRALIKKGTVVTELIKSCVLDKNIDLDQLVAGDRNALMVAIRCTGYGTKYEPTLTCAACNTPSRQTYDLSQLPIIPLEKEPVSPGVNLFSFTLPVTKAVVNFKLLTSKDEEELLTTQERRKKMNLSATDTVVSDQLKASLVSVNNKTDRAALSFFVDHMPAQDSLALRDYITSCQPGIDMTQLFTCDNCDHSEEVQIPISVEFFWPNAGKSRKSNT